MSKLNRFMIIGMVLLLSIASIAHANPEGTNIVISQVLFSPLGPENQEWIELYNPTETAIDISNWNIYSFSKVFPDTTIPEGKTIQPKSFFLIGDLAAEPQADYSEHLWLTNANSGIQLRDDTDEVIDTLGWGNSLDITTDYYETSPHTTVVEGNSLSRMITSDCSIGDTDDNSADFYETEIPEARSLEDSCDPAICGDNIMGWDEVCDNTNLDGKTCIDQGYSNPQTLACSQDCLSFDTTGCTSVCGDNNIEPDEDCDDGNLEDGDGCSSTCQGESTICGDDIIGWDEVCDNTNLDGKTCQDSGYSNPDVLACSQDCLSFDTTGCISVCGDNNIEPDEDCDDGNLINDDGCSSICQSESTQCGNGIIEWDEICDGINLDGKTCLDQGYSNPDTLACSQDCLSLDTTSCTSVCGDNNIEPDEDCDDGNLEDGDGCSSNCEIETYDDLQINYIRGKITIDGVVAPAGTQYKIEILSGNNQGKILEGIVDENIPPFLLNNGYFDTRDNKIFTTGSEFILTSDACEGSYEGEFTNGGNGKFPDDTVDLECTIPPVIEQFYHVPEVPTEIQDVHIYADVTDNNVITNVKVIYSVNSATNITRTMVLNNSLFHVNLETFDKEDTIEYKITAIDTDNNLVESETTSITVIPADFDQDGFTSDIDCNDSDDSVYPGATDIKCDGIDQDCSGEDDEGTDIDNDSYKIDGELCGPVDCNDLDHTIYPGAIDILCDTIDQDCSGEDDEGTDADNDTYKIEGGFCGEIDCDDNDPSIYPTAYEIRCDSIDQDCSGSDDEGTDADNDTFKIDGDECGPIDCDDDNSEINPSITETCNGIDDNCDSYIDEENSTGCTEYYRDDDGDLFGLIEDKKCLCTQQNPYYTQIVNDCDDNNSNINPNITESCNGIDDNCDTQIDEDFSDITVKVDLSTKSNDSTLVSIELLNETGDTYLAQDIRTDADGESTLSCIPLGIYDINAKPKYYLMKTLTDIDAQYPSTHADMGIFIGGDFNEDNRISVADMGMVRSAYGQTSENPVWNIYYAKYDLFTDNRISVADMGVVRSHYTG